MFPISISSLDRRPLGLFAPLFAAAVALGGCSNDASESTSFDTDDGWAGVPVETPGALPDPAEATYPATGNGDRPTGTPLPLHEVLDERVNLVFVGFTNCPDICPVHLANLGTVLRDLPLELSREVGVAFVSADPARDSIERIEAWLGALDPDFVGFRPTRNEVNALEEALGIQRSVVDPTPETGDYLVAHAGQILALDAQGRVRMAYPWGIRQRDWKADLPKLIRGEWPALPDGGTSSAPSATEEG